MDLSREHFELKRLVFGSIYKFQNSQSIGVNFKDFSLIEPNRLVLLFKDYDRNSSNLYESNGSLHQEQIKSELNKAIKKSKIYSNLLSVEIRDMGNFMFEVLIRNNLSNQKTEELC